MDKTITLVSCEQYEGDYPPNDLIGFQDWLKSKTDQIPQEFWGSAVIDFRGTGGYEGECYGYIKIHYRRPETPDEATDRIKAEKARNAEAEARERRELRRLLEKFSSSEEKP